MQEPSSGVAAIIIPGPRGSALEAWRPLSSSWHWRLQNWQFSQGPEQAARNTEGMEAQRICSPGVDPAAVREKASLQLDCLLCLAPEDYGRLPKLLSLCEAGSTPQGRSERRLGLPTTALFSLNMTHWGRIQSRDFSCIPHQKGFSLFWLFPTQNHCFALWRKGLVFLFAFWEMVSNPMGFVL